MNILNLDFIQNGTYLEYFYKKSSIRISLYSSIEPNIFFYNEKTSIIPEVGIRLILFQSFTIFYEYNEEMALEIFLENYDNDNLFQLSTIYDLQSVIEFSKLVNLREFFKICSTLRFDR